MKNMDVTTMDSKKEMRLKQRFSNLKSAYNHLSQAIELSHSKELNEIEKAGMIQYYEFTFEWCWKVMKDYLETEGEIVKGTKSVLKTAFQFDLLKDGDVWMEMLETRNHLSHTYKEDHFLAAYEDIKESYYTEIKLFVQKMDGTVDG